MSSISIPVYSESHGSIYETTTEVYYDNLPEVQNGSWNDDVGESVTNKFKEEAKRCANTVRVAWESVSKYADKFDCKTLEYSSRSSEIYSLEM